MTVIPFQINANEYSIFVALGDDNIGRIRVYDPAQVEIGKLGLA